jgi:hypothetical protein
MSAAMERLAEQNPNIGEHLRDWQIARTQNNEDSYDWAEFRAHEQRIGAPDPGDEEPEEFRQYDWTAYAPSSAESSASSGSGGDSGSSGGGSSSASSEPETKGQASAGGIRNPFEGVTEAPAKAAQSLWDFLRRR